MITRGDLVQWVMERMGSLSTTAEAEAMVDLLEQRGYEWRDVPGTGIVIEPDLEDDVWFALADEAVRRAASQEHAAVQWHQAGDGAWEAALGTVRLEAYWDTSDPASPGWAWRVTLPGHQESGPAESLAEAQAEAEACARQAIWLASSGS